MKPLYSKKEFNLAKSQDKLPCKCYNCKKPFLKMKKEIKLVLNDKKPFSVKFCSRSCYAEFKVTKQEINCANCNKKFQKKPNQIKKTKNNFCSCSCSVTYNNKHKTHGTRRSKLEIYLEEQLTKLYPKIDFHFNHKDTINSELDIYIPSLNIAFELNGIFHYEPIYGTDKLQQIQKNDISKTKACHEAKIDLCTIDTSQQKYFKPKSSQKYIDIITKIINERFSN